MSKGLIINKQKSEFFKFNFKKNEKSLKVSTYKGWNNSIVTKIILNANEHIDRDFIKRKFPKILNKEKIFIISSGSVNFNSEKQKFKLKKFDALSIFLDDLNYSFKCKKKTQLFLISSEKLKKKKKKSFYFNFKKDIKAIDIWGGKCISRPYSGVNLNVVLFDLKKGFIFNDNGHRNEQITWLISGSMNFYSGNLKNKLTKTKGIDIGPFHQHGGVSNGAIGFDAFFPKRSEKKYKHKVRIREL